MSRTIRRRCSGLDRDIAVGQPASFNVFNAAGQLQSTILNGALLATTGVIASEWFPQRRVWHSKRPCLPHTQPHQSESTSAQRTARSRSRIPSGAVELVSFPTAAAVTESFRSILYLEQHKHAATHADQKLSPGLPGIEHYLDAEHKGRLIQSLKSYLTSRTLTGTEVFGRRYTIEDLISRILTDLRLQAEKQFNQPIRHATVGRPVRFVGAESDEDDTFATERLTEAFLHAGFESVEFEMEPIAAAYAYESTLDRDELILIGDFGGGTSDFSLLHVGPGVRSRSAAHIETRATFSATLALGLPATRSTRASCASWSRQRSARTASSAPMRWPPTAHLTSFPPCLHGSTPTSNGGTTFRF